jgi:tRNA(fMet)-specific endonuclease VapC
MYMLDTNICIYVLNNRTDKLRHKFNATPDLCISVITYSELHFGIENGSASLRKRRREQLALFSRRLQVLPLGAAVGPVYGSIRANLKSRGEIIGGNDLFIAAHALSEGAILVSNNVREFERVPGLVVENWVR